jgi:ComEC/Rec2-related protein
VDPLYDGTQAALLTVRGPGRRPLVGLAIVFVAGIACGLTWPTVSMPAFCIGMGFLIVTAITTWMLVAANTALCRWPIMLCACTFLLAWGSAGMRDGTSRQEIVRVLPVVDERVDVQGIIDGDPDRVESRHADLESWVIRLRVVGIKGSAGRWHPCNHVVRAYWNSRIGSRQPVYGDKWEIRNLVGMTEAVTLDQRRLRVYPGQIEFLSSGHGSRIASWRYESRARTAAHLSLGVEQFRREANFLQALLLGYRSRLHDDIKDLGAATGTLHVFAVSGLHVGIVAGLAIVVLGVFGVSRIYWVIFLAPLLIAYTMLTGARPSAVRACIMAIVYFLAPAIRRRSDAPSALAASAILILVWDPQQLRDVGFIYSFVVVIGLVSLYPLFFGYFEGLWRQNAMGPDSGAVESGMLSLRKYITGLVALSCAAWLSSSPLTALFFGRITPIAVLANIVVIPLAFLIVLCGSLSLVLGSCANVIAEIFNHAYVVVIKFFITGIERISQVPFGQIEIKNPPVSGVIFCYAVIVIGTAIAWDRQLGKRIDSAQLE